jgi:hypothetical protein
MGRGVWQIDATRRSTIAIAQGPSVPASRAGHSSAVQFSGVQVAERRNLLGLHRADDLGIGGAANVWRNEERRSRGNAQRSRHRFEHAAAVAQDPGRGAGVSFERLGFDQTAKLAEQLVRHLVSEPDEASVPSGVDPQPTQADDPALAIDV